MTVLQDIYFITSCFGFIYIVGAALMGGFHTHQGGGHAGHGHSGHLGHSGSHGAHSAHIGHGHSGTHSAGHASGAGHSGAHGSSAHGAGHGAAHSGTHGPAGGAHGSSGRAAHSHGHGTAGQSQSGTHGAGAHGSDLEEVQALSVSQTSRVARRAEISTAYLKVLDILNPTKLAFFAVMFGAVGFISIKLLPGYLSLIPAILVGGLFANLFFNLMGMFVSRLHSSTNFKKESLIGAIGELSLSIESGGIGEVVVRTGNSRYNFPAKPAIAEQSIKKLAKVIVVDIKDGMFYVEPFEDL